MRSGRGAFNAGEAKVGHGRKDGRSRMSPKREHPQLKFLVTPLNGMESRFEKHVQCLKCSFYVLVTAIPIAPLHAPNLPEDG